MSQAVTVSRFMHAEAVKFERSHTRVYLALILDVLHNHNGVRPATYTADLLAVAPNVLWGKFLQVVKPALNSKHKETLASFAANGKGLDEAQAWFENQAKLAAYTLSLEDMNNFFSERPSTKAQREQAAKDNKDALTDKAASVLTQAIQETARKGAADSVSAARSVAAQVEAESVAPTVFAFPTPDHALVGDLLADTIAQVTIASVGESFAVHGLDALNDEQMLALFDAVSAKLHAAHEEAQAA